MEKKMSRFQILAWQGIEQISCPGCPQKMWWIHTFFSIHSSWDWRVLQEQGCVVNGMLCRSKRSLSMPICRNFGHPRLAANRAPYVHPPYPPQHRPTIVLWSEKFAYHGMIMESLVSLTWIASVCSSPRGVSTFMLWATMCHTSKGMVPVPMDRQKLKDRITPHVNFFQ